MRAVVTRVKSASVEIEGKINGEIGRGYLILLGVGPNDSEETAVKLADRICNAGRPVSPARRSRILPFRCMKNSWPAAGSGASL